MLKNFVMLALGMVLAAGGCEVNEPSISELETADATPSAPSVQTATPLTTLAQKLTLDLGDKVPMRLVLIPAGKFLMGSPVTEKDRGSDEVQREVTISQPFYMGTTHVTVNQFAIFVKESGYKTDAEKDGRSPGFEVHDGKLDSKLMAGCSWRNPGFDQEGDYPVVQVSWRDAQAFCRWLTRKTGKLVVLPTEAQWEYACRAGTTTVYPWGDNPNDGNDWANAADQRLKGKLPNVSADAFFARDDGFAFTSPVAGYKANAFGLYDMIGNASQWCRDWYGDYDKRVATNSTGPIRGDRRVLRGGSWCLGPAQCRSACRTSHSPAARWPDLGFRVVVVVEGAE